MRFEDDFMLRQLKQLVELVAAALRLKQPEDEERAQAEIDDLYRRLLNMDRTLFETLDAASVARLLGDADRALHVALVMHAEAQLWESQGEQARARRRGQRALRLLEGLTLPREHASLREELEALVDRL